MANIPSCTTSAKLNPSDKILQEPKSQDLPQCPASVLIDRIFRAKLSEIEKVPEGQIDGER